MEVGVTKSQIEENVRGGSVMRARLIKKADIASMGPEKRTHSTPVRRVLVVVDWVREKERRNKEGAISAREKLSHLFRQPTPANG
jgi:hypothetical protein